MKTARLITMTLAFSLAAAGAVLADNGKGKGGGKGGHDGHRGGAEHHEYHEGRDRDGKTLVVFGADARGIIESYYRQGRHCPPGLAKKRNGCLPPGQAKKRYQVGYPLPGGVVIGPLPPYLRDRLPRPPSGHIYGYVDNDVLLIAEATHQVVDAVVAVNAVMNALD